MATQKNRPTTTLARPSHAKRSASHGRLRRLSLALLLGLVLGLGVSGGLWTIPTTAFLFQGDPGGGAWDFSFTPFTSFTPSPPFMPLSSGFSSARRVQSVVGNGLGGTPALNLVPNPILRENALPGSTNWLIANGHAATTQIQGYASAESATAGQELTFYVSTQLPAVPYTVDVYRLGWYHGAGGRLLTTLSEVGQAQGYYDWVHLKLVGCASCRFDPTTRMLDADWRPSFQLTIPASWTTGLYVAKLTTSADSGAWQTYIHFTVTGDPAATYVATIPDTTTEAYNDWGGYSLYHGPDGRLATRAFKVSLNRPALGWRFGYGSGLSYVLDAIRWFERNGYDMAYISTMDLHEHPGVLLTHRAYLSLGHDEYWSAAMRNGVEQARNAGIGLAFLGANPAYWNMRFEPDRAGVADRVIVCYKSAALDPLYGRDNANVTVEWRQPPLNRPENALVGIMYTDWTYPPTAWPWRVTGAGASDPLMAGTGLRPGDAYGCNLVGYEFDHIFYNGQTPAGLHVLAQSYADGQDSGPSASQTTYYIARSGALVFASGSIYWSYALDGLHLWDVPHVPAANRSCLGTAASAPIPGIQRLMANVMAQLIVNHLSMRRPQRQRR